MKRVFIILPALLMTAGVFAQAPQKMSYQAVIRDASNKLVVNQTTGMKISILQGSANGTVLYAETQAPQTNSNGLVSIQIGGGTLVTGAFGSIDWSNGPYFIKTETDPTGGTSYSITGTSQLLSVPYAMYAKTAETVTGSITEADPLFGSSAASGITGADITKWNNKLDTEADGSVINEIQDLKSVLATGNNGNAKSIVNVSQITLGSSTSTPGTALEINSTQGALLLPRMTTAQRNVLTPVNGMIIYNTDEKKFQGYSLKVASPAVDQQHLTINNGGGEDRAQSFTAGISGDLTSIELPLSTMAASANIRITIRNGDGTTGTILHTQTFTIPGGGLIWYPFNITGVSVLQGATYTIHVTEVVPGACGMLSCYNWGMDTSGNNYSGGLFYYSGTPYSGGINDCAFKTYVSTATTWVNLH